MNIEDVTVVTDELVEELGRLMTQLSQSASPERVGLRHGSGGGGRHDERT